jgi:hypothetical protein
MDDGPRSTLAFSARRRRRTTPSPAGSPRRGGASPPAASCSNRMPAVSTGATGARFFVLERRADAAAGGRIAGGYVGAPDRPARRRAIKDESGWSAPAPSLCGAHRRLGHLGEGVRLG